MEKLRIRVVRSFPFVDKRIDSYIIGSDLMLTIIFLKKEALSHGRNFTKFLFIYFG